MIPQDAKLLLENVIERAKTGRAVHISQMELTAIQHALSSVRENIKKGR